MTKTITMSFWRACFPLLLLATAFQLKVHAGLLSDSALTVSKIVITGNEITKDYVILREMSVKVGSPLDTLQLDLDQKRIYSLQLFNRVEMSYTVEGNSATVVIQVSERWYIWPIPVLGFKYRDLKKVYYGISLTHQNFRGRNEKIMASAVFGYDGWFDLSYQNPKLTESDDIFFSGTVGYSNIRNQNVSQGEYNQKVFSTNATIGERYGLFLMLSGFVGYDLWDIGNPAPGATASPTGKDHFISLGTVLVYDRRDVREYPLKGIYAGFSVVKSGLGESAVNLFRYAIDLRGYQPLGDDAALCGRAFGSFLSGGITPSYLHVYFGYEDRIRGYFNTVLEGEDIIGSSAELRLPILKPRYLTVSLPFLPPEFSVWRYGLYAGIFADAGTIWYRTQPLADSPWYAGYGAGLHFLLPYSVVIRTEYAWNQHGRGDFVFDFQTSF